MSKPQNIKNISERRRSIALLTRPTSLSQSPFALTNNSPRGSVSNSYISNSQFLRGGGLDNINNNYYDDSINGECSINDQESSEINTNLNENENIDLSNGIDNPESLLLLL